MDRSEENFITNFVHIKRNEILLNGKTILSFRSEMEFNQFLKESYKGLELNYPKYHKMDSLCKLGVLGTSVLLKDQKVDIETALVISNASSSIDIDRKHHQAMDGIVSPAIFVYTLPNIVLGEISIKYKLQSENAFFIEDRFNAELLTNYSEVLLASKKASSVVCGWIELKNDVYDVFLCLISAKGEIPFSKENLEELYRFKNE
jgi:hypothetical protein